MDEYYGVDPQQTAGPSLTGTGLNQATSIGVMRATTIHRALKYGPTSAKDPVRLFFGSRQTADEMERLLDPTQRGFFGTPNWRGKIPGYTDKFPTGMVGTKFSVSSWLYAADLVQDEGRLSSYADDFLQRKATGRAADVMTVNKPLSATDAVNQLLDFNKGKSYAPFNNFVTGLFFDPGDQVGSDIRKAVKEGGRRYNAFERTLMRGEFVNTVGKTEFTQLTKLARFLKPAIGFAGTAAVVTGWAQAGYVVGKAAYKGWELYNLKAPMSAYKAVGSQITRASFAGGDSAYLETIPANNRLRAMQAIQGSRLNARSALGNEASLLAGHFR